MDILFSTIGLALGAIPIGLAMIAIKLTSPGPVFFRQERTGRNGVPFTLVKLRTMIPNAEQKTGAVYTEKEDPRITPVGRFLRKTRIDEIPQLWNVLKGEMSLIGPRPERREFVEQFERAIPYYAERLAVRPGITGWAQVKYPYASNLEETKQKLQYDLYYIKNMSLVLDFVVILMTIKTILFAKGQ
jgi:exopolysaccharide biosynthesis polyprenyl glycosylphosphotransferase